MINLKGISGPSTGQLGCSHEGYTRVELQGERPVLETLSITADRPESLESRVGTLHAWMFGEDAVNDCRNESLSPSNSVSLQAGRAFNSSTRLESQIIEIMARLIGEMKTRRTELT